jgi:hypothetical protein
MLRFYFMCLTINREIILYTEVIPHRNNFTLIAFLFFYGSYPCFPSELTWKYGSCRQTPWTGDQPCRKAATYRIETKFSVFKRAKTFHFLHYTATVVGSRQSSELCSCPE